MGAAASAVSEAVPQTYTIDHPRPYDRCAFGVRALAACALAGGGVALVVAVGSPVAVIIAVLVVLMGVWKAGRCRADLAAHRDIITLDRVRKVCTSWAGECGGRRGNRLDKIVR